MISHGSTSPDLSNKADYPYFARTVSPDTNQALAWIGVANGYGWKRVGIIATSEDVNAQMALEFSQLASQNDINVQLYASYVPGANVTAIIEQFVEKRIRIIFIACYEAETRKIWEAATNAGMIAEGYALIGSDAAVSNPDLIGLLTTIQFPGSGAVFDSFKQRMINVSGKFDDYQPFTYDAVVALALATRKALFVDSVATLSTVGSEQFRRQVMDRIFNLTFPGVSGIVTIDEFGDRRQNYNLRNSDGSKWNVVGTWDALSGVFSLNGNAVMWLGGGSVAPIDTYPGDIPDTVITVFPDWAIAVIVVISILLLVAVGVGIYFYKNPRIQKLQEPDFRKIVFSSDFIAEIITSTSTLPSAKIVNSKLQMWENIMLLPSLWPELLVSLSVYGLPEKDLCEDFVMTIHNQGQIVTFLSKLMEDEVSRHSHVTTVFREETLFIKCFRVYVKMASTPFLWHSLAQPINEFLSNRKEGALEVDVDRMDSLDLGDLYSNKVRLVALSQEILNRLLDRLEELPENFFFILRKAADLVSNTFPDSTASSSIGNLLFLRTICPAIVDPSTIGLQTDHLTISARRDLVLVSKVIQNLANLVEFGEKENFMRGLNEFIVENQPRIEKLYEKISSNELGDGSEMSVPDTIKNACVRRLYRRCFSDPDRLKDFLRIQLGEDFDSNTTESIFQSMPRTYSSMKGKKSSTGRSGKTRDSSRDTKDTKSSKDTKDSKDTKSKSKSKSKSSKSKKRANRKSEPSLELSVSESE